MAFSDAFEVVSDRGRRVAQADYLDIGSIPVVDQGSALIGGYTDDASLAYEGNLPLIVFGDHTRRVKLIDFRFAVGAQGVKLLRSREGLDARFIAYQLRAVDLTNRGYGRHFALLRDRTFAVPPIDEQRRIVDIIEDHLSRLDAARVALDIAARRLATWEAAILGECYRSAERVPLGSVTEIQGGIQK